MSILKDIITIKDGESYCVVRIIMVCSYVALTLCVVSGFILECIAFYHMVMSNVATVAPKFDAMAYSGAVTSITLGGAGGILLKQKDEPN